MTWLLQIEKVSKGYTGREGTLPVVDEVSLNLETGQTLGIVGESGAGKSTLVRMIMGLERPTSGVVTFEGQPISHLKEGQRQGLKKEIQMIWQDPHAFLNPFRTIEQLIVEPLIVFKIGDRSERRKRVRELAAMTGLEEEVLPMRPDQLSGGQAQRVAIARALALNPKLLLCDEILTSLDSPRQVQILDLLKELNRRLSLSVILVSHDLAAVAYLCNYVAVMHAGRMVEKAATVDFLRSPRHPYSLRFLEAAKGR